METTTGITQGRFVVPSVVATHFHIREGDVVGDFGAGSGFFIEILSQLTGYAGRVYACEIQKELVEKIGTLVRSKGLSNVDPLWCDLEEENGVKITSDALDVGVVINTLFQIENKGVTIQEIARTLRSGGKLFIIDWSESFNGLGPQPAQVITADQVKAIVESRGFVFERSFDAGDHHYGLAFRKI